MDPCPIWVFLKVKYRQVVLSDFDLAENLVVLTFVQTLEIREGARVISRVGIVPQEHGLWNGCYAQLVHWAILQLYVNVFWPRFVLDNARGSDYNLSIDFTINFIDDVYFVLLPTDGVNTHVEHLITFNREINLSNNLSVIWAKLYQLSPWCLIIDQCISIET